MSEPSFDESFAKARAAIAASKYKEAKELYEQATRLRPDSPDAHYGLATCCFLLGELDGAAEHFTKVTRLEPTRATAHINLGAICNRRGLQDEAIAHLRKGLQLDPRRAEGYYNLGIAYRQKGLSDLAIQAYREATRLSPKMADAYLNLANALFDAERHAEAVASYKQALELRPNFEKAIQGLRGAEQAMAAAQKPLPTAASVAAATTATHDPAAGAADAHSQPFHSLTDRTMAIEDVRGAATSQEELTRELLRVLDKELSPALHDLSHSLVQSTSVSSELDLHVAQYESALQSLRNARRTMLDGLERIRKLADRFSASAAAGPRPA